MNKKISTPIAIIIIIVLAILVGGITAWQYFGMPKGEEKIIEMKSLGEQEEEEEEEEITNFEECVKKIENVEDLATKYIDEEFGYSFYYPKSYKISSENPFNPDYKPENTFWLTNLGPWKDDVIFVSEYTGEKYEQSDAKFGYVAYYYDKENKQWMKERPDASYGEKEGIYPVEPPYYTISGLPVFRGTGRWATRIVALSEIDFLTFQITGSGWTEVIDPLTKTVTRTDQGVDDEELKNSLKEVICSSEK